MSYNFPTMPVNLSKAVPAFTPPTDLGNVGIGTFPATDGSGTWNATHLPELVRANEHLEAQCTRKAAELADLSNRIPALESELETARAASVENWNRFTSSQDKHARDIRIIGAELLEQAEEHNWCSQFDDVVDTLNRTLHIELPTRIREFTVEVRLRLTIEARDSDAAYRIASEAADRIDEENGIQGVDYDLVDCQHND